jgi:hypothetical protein
MFFRFFQFLNFLSSPDANVEFYLFLGWLECGVFPSLGVLLGAEENFRQNTEMPVMKFPELTFETTKVRTLKTVNDRKFNSETANRSFHLHAVTRLSLAHVCVRSSGGNAIKKV